MLIYLYSMFPYDITFLMQVILIILVCCCRPILADCSCCPIFSFLCNVCGSFVAVDQFKLIVRVARSLVFCVMFVDRWFSVIRFAASDYLLGNLSLWLLFRECHALCIYFFLQHPIITNNMPRRVYDGPLGDKMSPPYTVSFILLVASCNITIRRQIVPFHCHHFTCMRFCLFSARIQMNHPSLDT